MKLKPMTALMALFISISAYGKAQNKAILIEEISLQQLQDAEKGHICKADMDKALKQKLKKDVYLIGQMRTTLTPDQKGVVQIVWTGIQVKDKKRPKAYFKKPLISTFKANSPALAKGTQIDLIGDTDQIAQILEDLDKGKAQQTAQGLQNNPQAAERRVDDARTLHGQGNSLNSGHPQGGRAGNGSGDSQGETPYQGGHLGNSMENGAAHGDGRSNQGNAGAGYGQSAYRESGVGSKGHATSRPYSSSGHGMGSSRMAGSRMYGNGNSMPSSSFASSGFHPSTTSAGTGEGASPNQARRQEKDNLNPQGESKDGLNPDDDDNGSGSKKPVDADDPFNVGKNKGKNAQAPNYESIDVEITEQGCKPRIDFEKGKYIIQNRSIMRQGGKVIQETACGDSSIWYPIKKDYGVCQDEIDKIQRVAYTRFQRYWQDKDGTKNYLDPVCQRDESRPHPFMEESSNCTHFLDVLGRKAWRQAETIYYDRANARQLAASCHKVGEAISIVNVQHKCKPQHLFDRQYSVIQQRAIFTDQGVEHEVLPCHATDQTLPHEFVKANCKAVVTDHSVVPMAKRQITVDGKARLITSDCEPLSTVALQATTTGCEGQIEHDFEAGRSYPKVRWFYVHNNRTKFVTSCVRSKEHLSHQIQPKDYKHDDVKHRSIPWYEISIQMDGKKLVLRDQLETSESRFIAYTLVKKGYKHVPLSTRNTLYLDHYRMENLYLRQVSKWKRPDGTFFEDYSKDYITDPNIIAQYRTWLTPPKEWAHYQYWDNVREKLERERMAKEAPDIFVMKK